MDIEERLSLFVSRYEEMTNLRHFQNGGKVGFNVKFDADTNKMSHEVNIRDEEDFRSFLLVFRKFVSQNEPIYLNRIINECIRRSKDKFMKTEMTKAKEDLNRVLTETGGLPLVVNGKPITGDYSLKLWINGYYFHDDVEKMAKLKELETSQIFPLMRAHFLFTLTRVTNIVTYIGSQVEYGLGHELFDLAEDFGKEE